MTNKELLELAAKAAGHSEVWYLDGKDTPYVGPKYVPGEPIGYTIFNPLKSDGDALRLAVKLGLEIRTDGPYLIAVTPRYVDNEYAATRRAIVKAAAEIGKNLDES